MICVFTTKVGYARIVGIKEGFMLKEKRRTMNKNEFLDDLRRNLSGELPVDEIESNIRFYSEYITSSSPEEEQKRLEEVGNPRLIAMNIIETYKMSHTFSQRGGQDRYASKYEDVYEKTSDIHKKKRSTKIFNFKMKVMGALSVVLFIVFIFLLVKALSFALRLFLPVILVFFLVFLFRGIFRR